MDWLIRMNSVLDYIEQNLTSEIDYERIQAISCTSGDLFQRMFSHMTNISLSEYIRRRRLSDAAEKLSCNHGSVLETALLYGYDSPDAFSSAFKKYHGISPSQAKKRNITLYTYPKLSFQITMKGDRKMKYRIVEKKAFKVIGHSIKTSQEDNLKNMSIPKFWDDFNNSPKCDELMKHNLDDVILGVCYDGLPDGSFSYLIGVVSTSNEEGLEELTIPESTWAVFESHGAMPNAIQKVWAEIYENFLPTSQYEHACLPDFELYPKGDVLSESYYSEVWIPVVKKRD